MHKTILVLEESQMVHDLFESALPENFSNWTIEHESKPDNYLSKSKETNPDIIFLSNQDQKRDYATVKEIKAYPGFANTPILLLTSAKDKFDENLLQAIGVRGYLRKPFEMATLQKQIDTILREQEKARKSNTKDQLKNLNVIDDELLELISGKTEPFVAIDNLEEELDPTFQLIPEDSVADEDMEETELMTMDDSDDFEQVEFIEEEDDFVDLDEDDDLDLDLDESDTDNIEVEIEEIDDESDFMGIDDGDDEFEDISDIPDSIGEGISSIEVFEADSSRVQSPLINEPDDKNELGFMELTVIPLRARAIKSNVVETISEDFDEEKFVKDHSPAELEEDFAPIDIEFDIDETATVHKDEIVIPHVEIIEDFYDGDEAEEDDFLDDQPMQELFIEGLEDEFSDEESTESTLLGESDDQEEDVIFEELEDNDDLLEETNIQQFDLAIDQEEDEDYSVVEQEFAGSEDEETVEIEQTEPEDIEIDFENETDFDEQSSDEGHVLFEESDDDEAIECELTEGELEKRRNDQLDIDLEEIAAAGSEDASATIQEMIGFRQVMKAKYDIPTDEFEEEADGENEDLFADIDDEMEDEDSDLLADDDVQESFENGALYEEEQNDSALSDEDSEELDLMKDVEDDDQMDNIEMLADEEDALFDDGEDQLDNINLLDDDESGDGTEPFSDEDDLLDHEDDTEGGFSAVDEDDMFEDVDLMAEIDKEEDLLEASVEDEDSDDLDLLTEDSDNDTEMEDLSDESFEEIELLTDEEDEDSDLDLLQVDEETSSDEGFREEADDVSDIDLLISGEEEEIEDIDFLPVDEEEADIEEIPIIISDSQAEDDSDEGSIEDIDFLPIEDESDNLVQESDESEDEIPLDGLRAIDDADEITIEVPQEIFEISDFNINDLTGDEDESIEEDEDLEENMDEAPERIDLMEGIETVKVERDDESSDMESLDNMDLPSMDEDLPDLHPILDEDEDLMETPSFEDDFAEDKHDIQLMQSEEDFESFPGEDEVFGIVSDDNMHLETPKEEPSSESGDSTTDLDSQIVKTTKKALPSSLSPGFRKKLSAMIEGVISETVHNALQEKLPDMVEKLMHEETTEDQ
ncbi:hypothetical protein KJ966_30195 [bacterium]|nr:hypothetical protein [bacterium]